MENNKTMFDKAMGDVASLYRAQGKESDAALWFNMRYASSAENTITVDVPNEFMWRLMSDKGIVRDVNGALNALSHASITLTPHFTGEEISNASPSVSSSGTAGAASQSIPASGVSSPSSSPSPSYAPSPSVAVRSPHPDLRAEFTFDTFVPGENSLYAYNVCMAAAREPGKKFNPILLYGGVGLGKTHLMQAIGNYIYKERGGDMRIVCVSAERFGDDFGTAFRKDRANKSWNIDKFKAKYRQCDVLLIDDIHFLEGKMGMQDELFYTFNVLRDKCKQLVFTCDRPISQLEKFVDRLSSRLSNGQCVDLKTPNREVRRAILEKKLSLAHRTVEEGVADYIASTVATNVRDLESALNTVLGYAEMTHKVVDVELARRLLCDIKNPPPADITIAGIQEAVAKAYGVTVAQLCGKKRDKSVAYPRQVACYLCRELTESAFGDIGRAFGGRDHSTIIHACEVIEADRKLDGKTEERITRLINEIKNK